MAQSIEFWLPLLALLGFVFVLGVVTWLRIRHAADVLEYTTANMDAPVRRLGGACAVAAVGLTAALFMTGLEMRAAGAIAAVCGLGAMITMLGVLGMEGMLLERDSAAAQRIADKRPPPSSPRGRVIAIVVGLLPILGSAWVLLR
jgi:hypothetical protein